MINVADRIKELMEMKEWSPYELSNQTDISTNAIYSWLDYVSVPTLQSIIKVCEVFGITLKQFFCGGDYKYTEEENKILREWLALSDLEKSAVKNLMDTFKILKNSH